MDFILCEHITDKRLFHFKVNLHSLYAYECFYRISSHLDFSSLLSVYSLCLLFFFSLREHENFFKIATSKQFKQRMLTNIIKTVYPF